MFVRRRESFFDSHAVGRIEQSRLHGSPRPVHLIGNPQTILERNRKAYRKGSSRTLNACPPQATPPIATVLCRASQIRRLKNIYIIVGVSVPGSPPIITLLGPPQGLLRVCRKLRLMGRIMHFSQFLTFVLSTPFVMVLVAHACRSLLKTAQVREDADDERLWRYLFDPRSI